MQKTMVECPLCHGELFLYNDAGQHTVCPTCGGEGEVPVDNPSKVIRIPPVLDRLYHN